MRCEMNVRGLVGVWEEIGILKGREVPPPPDYRLDSKFRESEISAPGEAIVWQLV